MILQTIRDWAWLERSQWLDKKRLTEIQSRKLREIVEHAFRKVPLYHERFTNAGIDPSSIANFSHIRRIPIMTKQDARDTPLKERTAVDADLDSCIARTTSGSTGIPVTVLDEPQVSARRAALWLRRFRSYGVGTFDRACVVIPGQHRRGVITDAKGLFGRLLRLKIRGLSLAADIHDHIRLISQWKPDLIVGPASYYRSLIRFADETGKSWTLKVAIANGEMLDGSTRKLISNSFHTDRVFETWGAAEVGPIAWECPTHSGYHINAESLIVEILRNGEHVAPGEAGEICITNLYRRVTPMIRYLVGDIVTFLDADCSCGRGLPLVKDKQGRSVDFVLTRNGSHISPFRVMHMLEDVPGVAQYKVIQKSDYSVDLFVETAKTETDPVLQSLEERCKLLFGDLPVSIKHVDRIENPKGSKFRIVESQLVR